MFHLVNKYGNAHRKVKSERKRDELIALGYHEVKAPAEEERGVEVATATSAVVNDHPVDGQSRGGPSRSETVAPYDGPEQTDEPQQVDDPLQMYTTEDDTQATAAIKVTTPPQQVDDPLQMHTTEGDQQGAATVEDVDGATTEDDTEGTTEDSAQAVKDPEPATAPEPEPEPEPEAKAPKAAKTSKSTAGKSSKGAAKSNKTKKNAAEE